MNEISIFVWYDTKSEFYGNCMINLNKIPTKNWKLEIYWEEKYRVILT